MRRLAEFTILLAALLACKSPLDRHEPPPAPSPVLPPIAAPPPTSVPAPKPPSTPAPVTPPGLQVKPLRGVTMNVVKKHYDVLGSTWAQLWADMMRKRPKDQFGKRYAAVTLWYVRWKFPYEQRGGTCGLGTVNVTVDLTYTLPRWKPPHGVSSALITRWKRWERALLAHEYGHGDYGVRAANDIHRQLSVLGRRSTCALMGTKANALGSSILAKHHKQEIEYDRRTRHGAVQGAH